MSMKRGVAARIGRIALLAGGFLMSAGQGTCPPEGENRGIEIVSPTEGEEIVGPRTDIHARFDAAVIEASLQVILNGNIVNEYVHFDEEGFYALDVPLAVGENILEVRVLEAETRALLESSVRFSAGPPPISISQGYIFEVPLDIDPGRAEGPTVLTLYADFLRQDGFFASGRVQVLMANGELLHESPDIGEATAEVWGNAFVMSLKNLKLPLDQLVALVIEPLEAALGVNIPYEQLNLDELPWIDIELSGFVRDRDGDGLAEELVGEIENATFGGAYDLGVTGDAVEGVAYAPPYDASGLYLVDLPFSIGERAIKLTYHLALRQSDVTLGGDAVLLAVDDEVLVNLPAPEPVRGLGYDDLVTLGFDAAAPLENPNFVAFLEAVGIPIPPTPDEPVFHLALDGRLLPDSGGEVVAIEGSLVAAPRYGVEETRGRGEYRAAPPVEDGFSGGRLIETVVDLSELGDFEPVPMTFCANLGRRGALIEGSVEALRANGEPFDVSPGNTGTRGGVVFPQMTLALLALNGSGAKVFYAELNELYQEQTGQELPKPEPPEGMPDVPVEIPDQFEEVTFNLVGEIAPDGSAEGDLVGSILWGVPIAVTGSYTAPTVVDLPNLGGRQKATLLLDVAGEEAGPQEVVAELDLAQNGCALSGREKITEVRGRRIPGVIYDGETIVGANLGTEADIVFFDETLAEILEANPASSGPLVKVVLRGEIVSSPGSRPALRGKVFASFLYDQLPLEVGTFSTLPVE